MTYTIIPPRYITDPAARAEYRAALQKQGIDPDELDAAFPGLEDVIHSADGENAPRGRRFGIQEESNE